jgi:hypothetical protein
LGEGGFNITIKNNAYTTFKNTIDLPAQLIKM